MSETRAPFSAGAVPIPNRLFDEVLPALNDTELRVLLIVLRQTLGWREGSDRGGWQFKKRDWLTHGQLCRRTGRSSESVSKAISALVRANLLIVEAHNGLPMDTAQKRRRHLGRLYYRPVDKWITSQCSRSEKAKTTTDTQYNKRKTE